MALYIIKNTRVSEAFFVLIFAFLEILIPARRLFWNLWKIFFLQFLEVGYIKDILKINPQFWLVDTTYFGVYLKIRSSKNDEFDDRINVTSVDLGNLGDPRSTYQSPIYPFFRPIGELNFVLTSADRQIKRLKKLVELSIFSVVLKTTKN